MDEEITQIHRTSPENPSAAQMLGHLRLGQMLGRGLLGQVFEAHNVVAHKKCAVKLFRRDLLGGAVCRGRYVHEAETVGHIGHPGIAQIFGSGVVDGQLYTSIELVPGTPLSTLIRQQAPLSRRAYVPLLREICAALGAAHAYGIAHRHLHPGQILVQPGSTPQVRVLDFATHHLLPPLKDQIPGWQWLPEHGICVAPEQAKSGGDIDTRADIYALSVMLYEMVTGRVPFMAQTFAATLEQHASEVPVPPSHIVSIPSHLEETIMRGLDKDPRKRIPSVEAFVAALDPAAVATGQHQLVRARVTTTGRHRALTAEVSQEIQLPDVASQQQPPPTPLVSTASARTPSVRTPSVLEPMKVPRRRWWLFVALGVVLVGCVTAVTLLLTGPDPEVATRPRSSVRQGSAVTRPPSKTLAPRVRARTPTPPAPANKPRPLPRQGPPTATGNLRTSGVLAGRPIAKVEGFGALEIATPSPEAQVFVNGRLKGQGKLVLLPRLPVGTYRIHLVLQGKKTPHRDVHLTPNQRLTMSF